MAEIIGNKQIFSLLEVTRSIQKTLSERYGSAYWIKAEMNKLNFYKHSGHCYPELVEKQEGRITAQIRANLWKGDYDRINQQFLQLLKEPLKDGIKILFLAKISFDPVYGLALRIIDIDPSFTLGDLEKEKQESIQRLKQEGLFDQNKKLKMPLLPQRIAIISVETSKGYADFLQVIERNNWGYKFFHLLFPSLLQGDQAVADMKRQLNRIRKVAHHFDVVAIIRGGGGDVGLSCYNNYELAKTIATFPIPVISGIGHATNETVSEMVSFSNAITPTKLAENLIQYFHNFSVPVQEAKRKTNQLSKQILREEQLKFHSEIKQFRSQTENLLLEHRHIIRQDTEFILQRTKYTFKSERELLNNLYIDIEKGTKDFFFQNKTLLKSQAEWMNKNAQQQINLSKIKQVQLKEQIQLWAKMFIKNRQTSIQNLEKSINYLDPVNVLKRGYSITTLNGKALKSVEEIQNGDNINTRIFEGTIISIVQSSNKNKIS